MPLRIQVVQTTQVPAPADHLFESFDRVSQPMGPAPRSWLASALLHLTLGSLLLAVSGPPGASSQMAGRSAFDPNQFQLTYVPLPEEAGGSKEDEPERERERDEPETAAATLPAAPDLNALSVPDAPAAPAPELRVRFWQADAGTAPPQPERLATGTPAPEIALNAELAEVASNPGLSLPRVRYWSEGSNNRQAAPERGALAPGSAPEVGLVAPPSADGMPLPGSTARLRYWTPQSESVLPEDRPLGGGAGPGVMEPGAPAPAAVDIAEFHRVPTLRYQGGGTAVSARTRPGEQTLETANAPSIASSAAPQAKANPVPVVAVPTLRYQRGEGSSAASQAPEPAAAIGAARRAPELAVAGPRPTGDTAALPPGTSPTVRLRYRTRAGNGDVGRDAPPADRPLSGASQVGGPELALANSGLETPATLDPGLSAVAEPIAPPRPTRIVTWLFPEWVRPAPKVPEQRDRSRLFRNTRTFEVMPALAAAEFAR